VRTRVLILLIAATGWPVFAAKPVTIQQLEQVLSASRKKADADLAWQIADQQLTERLSARREAELDAGLPGEMSRQALRAVGDASQFLPPPVAEIPATANPSLAEQKRMMGLVVTYVHDTIPRLPNFFATRKSDRFEDTPQMLNVETLLPYRPMHFLGSRTETILYRDGRDVVEADAALGKKPAPATEGLTAWGVFGPILGTVLVDAAHSQLAWSRWEESETGQTAVFRFAVPKETSHYEVNYCCVSRESATAVADMFPFRRRAGYRGELAIDPASGTILRIAVEADLKPTDPVVKAAILVEYGAVTIGGKQYICPTKSISIAKGQTVLQDRKYKFPLANQLQPLKTSLNESTFFEYHMFRAEAQVLTANAAPENAGNEAKPDTAGASQAAESDPAGSAGAAPHVPGSEAGPAAAAVPVTAPPPTPEPAEWSEDPAAGLPDLPVTTRPVGVDAGFTLRTESRLVDVAVVAYDKKGHAVTDLKASDFEIYDNDKKQGVKYISQAQAGGVVASTSTQTSGPALEPVYSNRAGVALGGDAKAGGTVAATSESTILMIDTSSLAFSDLTYARGEMLRFMKGLAAEEPVGLYVLKSYGFEVLAEPTTDHAKVTEILTKFMPSAQDLAHAQHEEERNRQHIDWVAHDSDLAYVNGNEGTDAKDNLSGAAAIQSELHAVDPKLRTLGSNPLRDALEALQTIAHHLAALAGHKSLVWVSSDNALADWSSQAATREDKGMDYSSSLELHAREALNDSHVSLYPLDSSQLEAGVISADLENRLVQAKLTSPNEAPPPSANPTGRYAAEMHADTRPIQGTIRDLAEATGGRAFRRAGDIAAELNGVVADGRAAYMLSFAPEGAADDTYHHLTLKVRGRRDLVLRYRTGYFYAKEPATLKERFREAIWQPIDLNEIGVQATPEVDSSGATLKLQIAATDLGLAQLGERWVGQLDIFIVQRDDAALHAKIEGKTLSVRLKPSTYQQTLHDGLMLVEPVAAMPDNGALRVIVVDVNTGRLGTVTIPSSALKRKP